MQIDQLIQILLDPERRAFEAYAGSLIFYMILATAALYTFIVVLIITGEEEQ